MATFRTCQCQDGDAVVRCYEGRRQMAFRLKDALEDLNTRKKTKDSNRYFVETFRKFST